MNVWVAIRQHNAAVEAAEKNGFYIKQDREGLVALHAKPSDVWVNDVVIAVFTDFREVCVYMQGYANAKLHSAMEKTK